jgi:CDP-diacylglycerol pyrophosphatase
VERGYAVVKDTNGPAQYLLLPTSRTPGIETEAVRMRNSTNFFAEAWRLRSLFESLLHRKMPREHISLAVNSAKARSEDQLHIHIDCISSDVKNALARQEVRIGTKWQALPETLARHRYLARRIYGQNLSVNPFRILAEQIVRAKKDIGYYSLVVVGDNYNHREGFIVLAGRVNEAERDEGRGEELQDHSCALAGEGRTVEN